MKKLIEKRYQTDFVKSRQLWVDFLNDRKQKNTLWYLFKERIDWLFTRKEQWTIMFNPIIFILYPINTIQNIQINWHQQPIPALRPWYNVVDYWVSLCLRPLQWFNTMNHQCFKSLRCNKCYTDSILLNKKDSPDTELFRMHNEQKKEANH